MEAKHLQNFLNNPRKKASIVVLVTLTHRGGVSHALFEHRITSDTR